MAKRMKGQTPVVARSVEWMGSEPVPLHKSCVVSGCRGRGKTCRETNEGVYCLSHYLELPTCEECGRAGHRMRMRRGGVICQVVLCRACLCKEPKGYREREREEIMRGHSALSEAQDHAPGRFGIGHY